MSSDVWPVVFITWQSKIDETIQSIRDGRLQARTQKGMHVRKDADCIAISEKGLLIAVGKIDTISGDTYGLFLTSPILPPAEMPQLSHKWLQQLEDSVRGRLKGPVTAWVIPPNGRYGLDEQWFRDVHRFAQNTYDPGSKKQDADQQSIDTPSQDADKEAILKQWLPPILGGLLADRVRADKWELIIGAAFRALGCHVQMFGHQAAGRAEPDCIARYTSPTGQIIEILIDAKAGSWNGSIEDIRAMRDYHATANPYTYPLFVANSLGKDVNRKLQENMMRGKVPRAITGHDLALLIVQRLTRPDFDLEQELRGLLL